MATLTVRILGDLNKVLDELSEKTGILKSSLILYALNDRLRRGNFPKGDLFTVTGQVPVRITLRLPDALKELLEAAAKANDVSVNFMVNKCIYDVNLLYWRTYQ